MLLTILSAMLVIKIVVAQVVEKHFMCCQKREFICSHVALTQ